MSEFMVTAVAFSIGSVTVRWYGVIISCGMALGIFLAYREALRQHLDPDHLLNILLLLIPCSVLGARLYYVLFNWEQYAAAPETILAIWKGGLAIHGGVIAGVLVLILYCRRKKLSFFRWADILAPSLVLGQAIGRWGNFINHEAFGPVIAEGSFWSWVPLQVYANGAYHHPTFLYESVWDLLIFILLMVLIRRPHRSGTVFSWYLILYSLGRFFIEALRTDSLMLGSLKMAQLISLACIAAGIVILCYFRKTEPVDVSLPPQKGSVPRRDKEKNK